MTDNEWIEQDMRCSNGRSHSTEKDFFEVVWKHESGASGPVYAFCDWACMSEFVSRIVENSNR